MDTNERGPNENGGQVARGVVGIVLLGVALGVGFNALQLKAGPRKGLAWIKHEVKLASLESLASEANAAPAETAPGTTPAESAPAATIGTAEPVPVATGTTGTTTKSSTTKKKGAKGTTGTTAATGTAATKSATASHATGSTAATAATGTSAAAPVDSSKLAPATGNAWPAGVPAIPDTREPLEAQFATVKKLYDAGLAVFVDARGADEYTEAHISGATSLPFDDVFKDPEKAKHLDTHGRPVIVTYCGGGDCDLSRNLAFTLIEAGHKKVLVFMGGMPGWKEGDAPVATGTKPGTAP